MNANPKWSLGVRAFAVAIALIAAPAAAQNESAARAVGTGKLLIAAPEIEDASWAGTVLLVLHHDDSGTLAVALNRPTRVAPQEIVPDLEFGERTATVFRGGPIAPTQLLFLVENPPADMPPAARIIEGVYAGGDLAQIPRLSRVDEGAGRLRLYAGHAEWAPGQLAREVAAGRWIVAEATPDRVFAAPPESLWEQLRQRRDGLTAALTTAAGQTLSLPQASFSAAAAGLR